jgi:hypothetical protein
VLTAMARRGDVDAREEIRILLRRNLVKPVSDALYLRQIEWYLVNEEDGSVIDPRDIIDMREGIRVSPYRQFGRGPLITHRPARETSWQTVRDAQLHQVYGDTPWDVDGPGLWAKIPEAIPIARDPYSPPGQPEISWVAEWVPVVPREYVIEEVATRVQQEMADWTNELPVGLVMFVRRMMGEIL